MKIIREGLCFTLAATLAAPAANPDAQTVQTRAARGKSEIHGAYLIRNAALVLTMDPNVGQGMLGEMRDADVLLVKDHIQAVGHHLSVPHAAEVIDGTGKIVMPGF